MPYVIGAVARGIEINQLAGVPSAGRLDNSSRARLEPFAKPFECLSLAERSNNAAELMAPLQSL